jgi:hypothetical protein
VWLFEILICVQCINHCLSFVVSTFQVPERARGYLFEYELISLGRNGAVLHYTNRIYKPDSVSFETFKETEDTEEMIYPIGDLESTHEIWQQAQARVNAHDYTERQTLLAITSGTSSNANNKISNPDIDLTDIDTFFQAEGKGPKLLEFEFEPATPLPISYEDKSGRPSSYWFWKHKMTGQSVKRFANISGKSFDTGRLTKFLKGLKASSFPVAHARAQHILQLNESIREQVVDGAAAPLALDRKTLLGQQVRHLVGHSAPSPATLTQFVSFFRSCFKGQGCFVCR